MVNCDTVCLTLKRRFLKSLFRSLSIIRAGCVEVILGQTSGSWKLLVVIINPEQGRQQLLGHLEISATQKIHE